MVSNVASRISVIEGDITLLQIDAIVTAANESLSGGAGVDWAIHDAAGPELLETCLALGGCPTGEARITPGYRLRARHVIHAVGPEYSGGGYREEELLASCYRDALRLAMEADAASVAFPCLSTGMFQYPNEEACEVAVSTVVEWLATHDAPRSVIFCCYDSEDAELYRARLGLENA